MRLRHVSSLEHRVRQLVLRTVMPVCLEATQRASHLAETRFRRAFATQRHIKGHGIEVGAAATPAFVPYGVAMTYVDKYGLDALRSDPDLRRLPVRAPDIISSAERLEGIPSDSQDFVLAFSVLEHVQDVLGSLAAFHRVTRHNGSIILSIPDKRRYGPDQTRCVTPFDHVVRDYREGPAWSLADHYREIGVVRRNLSGEALNRFVASQLETDAHTHFHVWDPESFLHMLLSGRRIIGAHYEILEFASYGHETLAVLNVCKLPDAVVGDVPLAGAR